MSVDPVTFLVEFLRGLPDLPAGSVTGDLNSHDVGETTIYVEHHGGMRVERDVLDRADIEYTVYDSDREKAAALAYKVRDHFLKDLPNTALTGAFVLDVVEFDAPTYEPDEDSREHAFVGEIAVFYTDP